MNFANLSDAGCKAYNDAIRHAAHRAYRERECIWVYRKGETFFVRRTDEDEPEGARKLCIAQIWSGNQVQLRFDGAWSEWVYV